MKDDEPQTERPTRRFLTLKDIQDELQISPQAMSLVRSGELPAIQIGGRGQWRIERVMLEEFIAEAYGRGIRARRRRRRRQRCRLRACR